MAQFRKKPVVIDAFQLNAEAAPLQMTQWWAEATNKGDVYWSGSGYWTIPTKEGNMRAVAGDWIIRGTAGELYPCKPDIFAAIYEPA